MKKKKTKKTGWLSCLLVVLAALAGMAARDRSGRYKKGILYRFSFPCRDQKGRPVAEKAVSAYIKELASARGCGLAGGCKAKEEQGECFVFFLLLTEDAHIRSIGESVQDQFGLSSYQCVREERAYT